MPRRRSPPRQVEVFDIAQDDDDDETVPSLRPNELPKAALPKPALVPTSAPTAAAAAEGASAATMREAKQLEALRALRFRSAKAREQERKALELRTRARARAVLAEAEAAARIVRANAEWFAQKLREEALAMRAEVVANAAQMVAEAQEEPASCPVTTAEKSINTEGTSASLEDQDCSTAATTPAGGPDEGGNRLQWDADVEEEWELLPEQPQFVEQQDQDEEEEEERGKFPGASWLSLLPSEIRETQGRDGWESLQKEQAILSMSMDEDQWEKLLSPKRDP